MAGTGTTNDGAGGSAGSGSGSSGTGSSANTGGSTSGTRRHGRWPGGHERPSGTGSSANTGGSTSGTGSSANTGGGTSGTGGTADGRGGSTSGTGGAESNCRGNSGNCDTAGNGGSGTAGASGSTGTGGTSDGNAGAGAGSTGTGGAGNSGNGGGSTGTGGGGGSGGGFDCEAQNGAINCHHTDCVPGTHEAPCGACVPNGGQPDNDCVPPANGGCWITGGGFIEDADGKDSYGGNGMPMKDGTIRGQWEHQDHGTGNNMHGEVTYLVCRHVDEPGPGNPSGPKHDFNINQAYYGGPARFASPQGNWAEGYWFDVMLEDHGEPGNKPGPGNHGSKGPDYYHITIRQMTGQNQSGIVVYDTEGDIVGGNLQIHPPNNGHPFTSSSLPSWVSWQP